MSYEICLSAHDGYLRVEVSGERSREDSEELARYMAKVSADHDVFKILLLLKLTGRLGTFELHDLVSRFRDCGLGPKHKIAVVDENEESRPDQNFMEDVVRTRGLDAAAFDTERDALRWLFGSPPAA